MIRASRSPGRRTPRFRRAGVEWRCLRRGRAAYTRRSPCGSQSDRSLRGERRRSNGKETTLCSCCADLAVFRGVLRLGRPYVLGTVQVAPTPRIRRREVQRHGGSEAHGAKTSRPSNPKLALVAYWYVADWNRQIRHIRMVQARPSRRSRGGIPCAVHIGCTCAETAAA